MKHFIYSVRDEKTTFAAPFMDATDSSAMRGFAFAINNQSNMLNFMPADFSLYRVGEFDTESGILTPIIPPFFVCNATKFVRGLSDEE